jgi:pimeloyl-ACP methyl ester carboxylesterase
MLRFAAVGVAILLGGLVGLTLAAAYVARSVRLQRRLFGASPPVWDPTAIGAVRTDTGTGSSWLVDGPSHGGWVAVVVHGFNLGDDPVASDPSPLPALIGELRARGVPCVLPILGYAGDDLHTGGDHEADEVAAVAAWAGARYGLPVVLIGFSAGAHVVLRAAARSPHVVAAVADSAYCDIGTVLVEQVHRVTHVPSVLLGGVPVVFRRLTGCGVAADELRTMTVPVLLLHGAADTNVPPAHQDALASWIPTSTVIRPEGRQHNESLVHPDVIGEVFTWIDRCVPARPGAPS